ncbi:MAG: XTP/dITP diphosphatase [Acidobacteria bacterium]|nr:XTP/dITP diphosphatase [Acidobacteriota bacterium]
MLVATRNGGKVEEIKHLLAGLELDIGDLTQWPDIPEIEETGPTFAQNALMKAHYYHEQTGLVTIADDSGLEVAALGGSPGVRSARYAGDVASDAQRITKLLQTLEGVADKDRTARFVCVVALAGPGGLEKTFTGVCEGRIRHDPVGKQGFGYDPVFEYLPLGKTFAQLSREEKSAVSHRGRAMRQLREFLLEWMKQSA